ncbi:MAG: ornithine carbamoyltransferase [Pseudomonadota bacterium]
MNAFDIDTATTLAGQTRHFLELDEIPAADLRRILDVSSELKARRAGMPKGAPDPDAPLDGHVLAMVFAKPSTRTRVSFDVGTRQLGGRTMVMNGADLQLGRGETIADTAKVLSRYVDAIMIRTFDPADVRELAENADIPVINGLTDHSHPCQIMADILTFEEHRGPITKRKIAWTGDGNNVAATWVQAATAFDFEITIACPESLRPDDEILSAARAAGANLTITENVREAVAGADAVVTDTWLSMNDPDNVRERRHNLLRSYQVDAELMAHAKPDALFMHCLPAHRGEEATAEVMDGPQSVIFDEAENRLHVQKGILLWCLGLI